MTEGLEIKQSNLPNAGWGVFTTRPFKKGEKLTTFDGYRLPYYEIHDMDKISQELDLDDDIRIVLTHQDYIYEPRSSDNCIYGYTKEEVDKHKTGYGSLINDAFSITEWEKSAFKEYADNSSDIKHYNCYTRNCDVIALGDIEAGEELLTHYGIDFWSKKLNDDRVIAHFHCLNFSKGKTFEEFINMKYKNFELRESLNYTPKLIED